jgi:hypothetical protein
VALLCSRLWILSCDSLTKRGLSEVSTLVDNDFTRSFKANPSFFSNIAILSLVYLLLPLSKGLGKGQSVDSTNRL